MTFLWMRRYLQLTRAHTSPLEVVPAMLGASIAAGEFWSVNVALWGLYGLLYHLAGYGMNSYADWKNGFDKDDVHKQHHPLNSGTLEPERAGNVVTLLLLMTLIYGMWLAWDTPIALMALTVGIVAGVTYNKFGKLTILKPIPISIAHTSVYSAAYLDNTGQIGEEFFWLGSLYVFTWVLYQIAISGEVKDIGTDPENLLRAMGARTGQNFVRIPFKLELMGILIKSTSFLMVMFLSFRDNEITPYTVPVAFIGSLLALLNQRLLAPGRFIREQRVQIMSIIELTMLALFAISAGWIIGPNAVIVLTTGSVLWVLAFNQIEWGNWVAPDV